VDPKRFSTFHMVVPDPVSDPTLIFSSLLNINFTFVSPSCVISYIFRQASFLGDFLVGRVNLYFLNRAFF
jgi:hypothetical protein